MSRFWTEFWPQVLCVAFVIGVLGNLVASAVLGVPALWHLHRKLDRHHAERMAQAAAQHRRVLAALGIDPDVETGRPQ
jgi:hypothetical protein